MDRNQAEIIERWIRSCVLCHQCRDCPDYQECLKLAQSVNALLMILRP